MNQEEINQSWSVSSANYDRIIQDELNSFRTEAWQQQILAHFPDGKSDKHPKNIATFWVFFNSLKKHIIF